MASSLRKPATSQPKQRLGVILFETANCTGAGSLAPDDVAQSSVWNGTYDGTKTTPSGEADKIINTPVGGSTSTKGLWMLKDSKLYSGSVNGGVDPADGYPKDMDMKTFFVKL